MRQRPVIGVVLPFVNKPNSLDHGEVNPENYPQPVVFIQSHL